MKPHSIFTAAAIAFLAAGLIVASMGTALAQKRGGTLVYMIPSSGAPTLDGHRETTFGTVHPTAPFYNLLLHVDPRSKGGKKVKGDLATGWTVSSDKKTYTFKLHKGVKFHDGSAMTSEDVVASWKKIVFPPEGVLSARVAFFPMVKSITASDDYTVVFKMNYYSPSFINAVAMPYNYIYSADILKKDIHWYEKNIMGTGPFKFVHYVPGDKIQGKRNENYFEKGLPYLDGIEGIFARKQNVYVAALRGDRAHSMFRGLPPAAVKELKNARGDDLVLQESTWNCSLLITTNPYKKPFDDVRVRRALSLALDRHEAAKKLSKIGIVKPMGGATFPGHELAPSRSQLETLEGYWPDIKKSRALARKLLKEAGVPKGFKFTLNNRNTDQPYKVVGTWALDQWRKVGLKVSMDTMPTSKFWKRLREPKGGSFDVTIDFNCQSLVNPTVDISKYTTKSKTNYGDFVDPELDRLYDLQLRELDSKKQKELIWQFEKRLNEQAWTFVTLWWQRAVVHSAKMKYWEVTPSHYLNMGMAHVWLDQ